MPEDFRGPDLKLQRANHHIADLHGLLKRLMDAKPYKVVADYELEPGSVCWVARGKDLFAHDEFSPIISDALHNMRDALELAVSVLVRNAGASDKRVAFPVRDLENDFEIALEDAAKDPNYPQDLIDVLRTRIQPYVGGNGVLLTVLHRLAIMDKHRLLVPTVFGTGTMMTAHAGCHMILQLGPPTETIKDGSVLHRLDASAFPHFQVGQEALIALAVAFDERCGRFSGTQVEDGLRRLYLATKDAIEDLRTCLP